MEVAALSGARVRVIGLAGAAVQLALAVMLALAAGRPDEFPNPPHQITRGVALAALFVVPAVIGAIGAWDGRRSLLAAAAALSVIGSVLSFSGITLLFLAPALIFGAAARAGGTARTERRRPSWNEVAILVLASIGVIAASVWLGIFVIPVIVLLVVILQVSRGATAIGTTRSLVDLVAALSIVALVVGAGVGLFGLTETRCWEAYRTPTGIEYRDLPAADTRGTINLGPDGIAGGCDSGVLSAQGAAVASVLSLVAIGVAVATARTRRRDWTEVQRGAH